MNDVSFNPFSNGRHVIFFIGDDDLSDIVGWSEKIHQQTCQKKQNALLIELSQTHGHHLTGQENLLSLIRQKPNCPLVLNVANLSDGGKNRLHEDLFFLSVHYDPLIILSRTPFQTGPDFAGKIYFFISAQAKTLTDTFNALKKLSHLGQLDCALIVTNVSSVEEGQTIAETLQKACLSFLKKDIPIAGILCGRSTDENTIKNICQFGEK